MRLLLGHRYSHETLSALTDEVLGAVEAFRRRLLPEEMAFVYLDGLSLKVLRDGEGIVRETVYVALGIPPGGERRVLLFVTDGLPGLPEAIRRVYPQAEWPRCVG